MGIGDVHRNKDKQDKGVSHDWKFISSMPAKIHC